MMNATGKKAFLPAAGSDWALPLYDPLTRLLGISRLRKTLLETADLDHAADVLDIGCGTGALALLIKQLNPHVKVVGLDPDAKALARATRKTERASAIVTFTQGYSEELPYRDGSFDRVLSSFMFHHVSDEAKPHMLREAFRVLRRGGSFHMLDMARTNDEELKGRMKLHGMMRHMTQNSDSRIIELFQRAGFSSVKMLRAGSILFGTVRVACFGGSRESAR